MLTFKDKKFYLDGKEFPIRSGSLHYFRALSEDWEELLQKYKAAGLNCVETYCAWNLHEPRKGEFCFSGNLDIERFFDLAQKTDLKVILRPGPFICAEWDNGGFPAWLLKDRNIRLRCLSEPYMTHLTEYYEVLLEKIRRHTDSEGGPVIAIAVENEYGSYGADFDYLSAVEAIYRRMGIECLFFSADGGEEIFFCSGSNAHIIKGADFGPSQAESYDIMVNFRDTDKYLDGKAPYLAAEYWAGNFTHWGDAACYEVKDELVDRDFDAMVKNGIGFNDYMFFGGTNFGFMAGANIVEGRYRADITSYDYDAALTEWGAYTPRYHHIRKLLGCELPLPPEPEYQTVGKVELTETAELFSHLDMAEHVKSKTVESMEYYGQNHGYILYRKTMTFDAPYRQIRLSGLADRAWVYVNGEYLGMRMRDEDIRPLELPRTLKTGDVIDILVENMGRVNFGELTYLGDRKGITHAVFFSERVMFDWDVYLFPMDDLSALSFGKPSAFRGPTFYRGTFSAEPGKVAFIHTEHLTKGFITVNGFNLGRYWEKGPQTALYIPGRLLKEENEIVVFEAEGVKEEASVTVNDLPGLTGKTHGIR